MDRLIDKIVLIFITLFIIWVSFFSELLPAHYKFLFFYLLSIFLVFGFVSRRQLLGNIFSKENVFFWIYILAIGIMYILSCCSDSGIQRDISFFKLIIVAVPLYLFARYFLNAKNIKYLLFIWVGACVLVSFIGLLEFILGHNFIYENFVKNYFYKRYIFTHRMMATFVHPNILGAYLLVSLSISSCLKKTPLRKFFYPVFILILISILLTFSRGTWLALLAVTFIYSLSKKRVKIISLLIILFLSFLVFSEFVPRKTVFSTELHRRFGIRNFLNYFSDSHRTHNYLAGLRMFKAHPITGVGWGAFRSKLNEYSNLSLYYEIKVSDSVYLMHIAETGFIGSIPFLVLLFLTLRKRKNNFTPLTFSFTGLLLNFFTFDGFLWISTLSLFWFLMGVLNNKSIENF